VVEKTLLEVKNERKRWFVRQPFTNHHIGVKALLHEDFLLPE
jgi:hypothetical protein